MMDSTTLVSNVLSMEILADEADGSVQIQLDHCFLVNLFHQQLQPYEPPL